MAILLINGLKNAHLLKFTNEWRIFYSCYANFYIFWDFKLQLWVHTNVLLNDCKNAAKNAWSAFGKI